VILLLTVGLLTAGGCEPEDKLSPSAEPEQIAQQTKIVYEETAQAKSIIGLVCGRILADDFQGAEEIIKQSEIPQSKGIEQLSLTIDEYKAVKAAREQSKTQAYQEQTDKLEELRRKFASEDLAARDANELAEVFSAIIKAREYATKQQQQDLLEDDFTKRLIEVTLEKAKRFEAEGKWLDSYAHCYYGLSALDKDNTGYKDHADALAKKVMVRASMKDNPCETSIQRHEGITAQMLVRSVKVLHMNHVNIIDYGEMAKKGIARCRILGEVLYRPGGNIGYEFDSENIGKWSAGLDAIEKELNDSFVVVTRDGFLKVFEDILVLNSVTIKLDERVVIARFVESAFTGLDPYTTLFWPWQVKDLEKSLTQKFTGIGIKISKIAGNLKVISLIPNTPAYSSGLDADDIITAINGEPTNTEDMTIQCAVSKITGPRGTNVTLTVKHADTEQVEDITITRDHITVPTILGWQRIDDGGWRYMIDPNNNIGYIRITNFTANTAPDLDRALTRLENKSLKGLILDLRFNTGGYLQTAAAVVDMFVTDGLIVRSQPRWGVSTYEAARSRGTHPHCPLVVLINGSSASASEIVAGALQDVKFARATIVGSRSYGKGSVQTIASISGEGSQLRYTMAYYHLPSNQRVKNRYVMEKQNRKDWGIAPDIKLKLRNDEMRKMVEVQGANEVLARAGHNDSHKPLKRYSLTETIDSDPQLAVGLLAIRTIMLQEQVFSGTDNGKDNRFAGTGNPE